MAKIHFKEIKIPYLSENKLIMISEICNKDKEHLTISIFPTDYSFILIGDKRYELKTGSLKISARDIPDGISDISFIRGTKKRCASPIYKENECVFRAPADPLIAEAMEKYLVSLSERLHRSEEKILMLEEKINPKSMFNFT